MRAVRDLWLTAIAAVAIAGVAVAVPAADSDESIEKETKKIRKIRVVEAGDCADEECRQQEHRIVVIRRDAEPSGSGADDCSGDCRHEVIARRVGDEGARHLHVEVDSKRCEGEDCGEGKAVFIDEDGDPTELEIAMGDAFEWAEGACEEEDCRGPHQIFIMKSGQTISLGELGADAGAWTARGCDSGDCKEVRRIVIGKPGGMHGHGGHAMDIHAPEHRMLRVHAVGGGFLGIQLTDLTSELRTHFGSTADVGVMIGRVLDDSPAERAGLEVGDILVSVDGEPVDSAGNLTRLIGHREPGTAVTLGLRRHGTSLDLVAELGEGGMAAAPQVRKVVLVCNEEDRDCGADIPDLATDRACPEGDECELEVECDGDECTCTLNGEPADCESLGVPLPGGER